MRNTLTVILFAAVLLAGASGPAQANASKEEAIGVGSGALVGAAAGGPVGLIIGAAIGASVGDNVHRKQERVARLENTLAGSEHAIVTLENDLATTTAEIERLRGLARPELVSLMQAGIAMDLLFRTDEFVLADTTGDRLAQLAGTLATMPEIRIQLDGFADERGDEQYNLELSEKRVEFVRGQLVAAGINPDRISVSAHGESAAQDQHIDSLALERRVSVKLFIDDVPAVAANPH